MWINKGDRITAAWLETTPSSLAGAQIKTGAREVNITGVVRHLRGDHPIAPTSVLLFVDPDHAWDGPTERPHGCTCDHEHVMIKPAWVRGAARSSS